MGKSNIQNAIEKRGLLKTALLLLPLLLAIGGGVCEKADATTYPILHNSSTANSKNYWSGNGGWGVSPASKYGRFTCATCHNRSTANIKRIVDTIPSTIGPAVSKPVSFTNVTGQNSYGDDTTNPNYTTSSRICEVCHTLTIAHRYDNSPAAVTQKPNHQSASRTDCTTTCHPHSKGFAPAGGCTTCHGNPPTATSIGGPNGLASPATNALGASPSNPGAHDKHYTQRGIQCLACHNAYTGSPMGNTKIEIGFNVNNTNWSGFSGSVAFGTFSGNQTLGGTYAYQSNSGGTTVHTGNGTRNSCNVYCHGGWSGSNASKRPSWIGGSADATCGTCHGTTTAAAPTRASHPKHASNGTTAYAISCTTCHPSRPAGDTTHVTGSVQWRMSTGNPRVGATATYNGAAGPASTGTPAPSATYQNCLNVYCHSGDSSAGRSYKTVQWGATLAADCSGCHGNDAVSAVPIASRAHKAHVNNASASYSGLKFKCNECHNTVVDATNRALLPASYGASGLHTNGGVPDVAWGSISNGGGAYAQGATNCNAIYCHSDGGGTYKQPGNWSTYTDSTEGTAACDYCHNGLAGNTTPIASTKHTQHIDPITHTDTIPHAAVKCSQCHARTARANDSVYTNSTSQHINKAKNVRFNPYWGSVFTNHTGTYIGTTCANTHCHGNVAMTWSGAGGQRTCGDCHGTTNGGLLSGPHAKHYNTTTSPTTANGWTNTKNGTGAAYVFYCGTCHNVNKDTQHVNGPQVAAQGGAELVFNIPGNQGFFSATPSKSSSGVVNDSRMFDYSPNTSCSVYCHSNANEAAPAYRAVTWGGAAKVCGDCHAFSKTPLVSRDWSTKHEKHMKNYSSNSNFRCGTCHMSTVLNGTNTVILSTSKRHVDGYRNVSSNTWAGSFKYVPATKTCQSVYCHSAGRNGDTRYTNLTWTSSATTCLSCHGGRNGTTYSKSSAGFSLSTTHTQHLGKYPAANMNCQICHSKTAIDAANLKNYTGVIYHVNKTRDVRFTDIAYGSYTSYKTATKKCANVSCHGGTTRNAWTDNGAINNDNTCVHCHGTAGTTTAIANSGDNRKFFAPGWPKNSAGVANQGIDTDGEKTRTNAQVGAHFAHLSSVVMKKIKCNECHIVPSTPFDGGHMAQPRFTVSQTLSFGQASSAKWDDVNNVTLSVFSGYTVGTAVTDPATCSSVYCHGYRLKNGTSNGTYRKPYWSYSGMTRTGTQTVKCGRCHGIPPNQVTDHSGKTINDCSGCHPAVVNGSGAIINKALHINRTIEVVAGDCLACHSSAQSDGANVDIDSNGVRIITTEFTKNSHHVLGVSLTKQHCTMCHMEGDAATGSPGALHKNGQIDLRNVDTNTALVWTGTEHTNMDNFCFACHDSNGVSNATALSSVTGATATNPFNDTRTNSYDQVARSAVLDVKSQFTATNASHHAVSGAKYTNPSQTGALFQQNRFVASYIPLGGSLSIRDNSLMHCGDCHTVGQWQTVGGIGAHGSANEYMLRNTAGTDALHTITTYVCFNCHGNATDYTTTHSAGNSGDLVNTAGAVGLANRTAGDGNMTGMSCAACHNTGNNNWGGIHGGTGTYVDGGSATQTKYRFMPGLVNSKYQPGNWATTAGTSCYTAANTAWAGCNQHSKGGKAVTRNQARPLSY